MQKGYSIHAFVCSAFSVTQVHDSCAVLALTNPGLFTKSFAAVVDVECHGKLTLGVTVADMRGHVELRDDELPADGRAAASSHRRNVTVLMGVDDVAARATMVSLIKSYSAGSS